jgi:uncharacterized repeat protein (TIGR01451 family)
MLIKTLILAFLVGVSPLLYSQNVAPAIEWQKCFGGNKNDKISSTAITSDGGYIFVGESTSTDYDLAGLPIHGGSDFYPDIWVVKVAQSNTIEWQKRLGSSGSEVAKSIIQTNDGGYIISGITNANGGDVSGFYGAEDAWVVKLSASGSIQWQKCYGTTGQEVACSLTQTRDGGYIFAGYVFSQDTTTNTYGYRRGYEGWVVKISNLGAIEWEKLIGTYGGWEEFNSVRQTSDGGYILAGKISTPDTTLHSHLGSFDAWIVKLSPLGMVEWQKCLGGATFDVAYSVIQTTDGGYVVAAETRNIDNGDVTGGHGGFGDFWVVKLSKLGIIQWQKTFGGSQGDRAYSIIQTPDGGYIAAGLGESNDGDITHSHGSWADGLVLKLSEQGVVQWYKCLGGSFHETLSSIIATPDGGYLASGSTSSSDFDVNGYHYNNNRNEMDAWVVKLTPDIKAIKGRVELTNTACQVLTTPQYAPNVKVKIEKNNAITNYVSADSLGRFGILGDTGRYTISVIPPNTLWTVCPPKSLTLSNQSIRDTTTVNPTLYINSICPLMEVNLTTPFLRRCFESQYVINYANRGTAIQNDATAELTLDSALTYVSATRPIRSRVGNKITFSLGNVGINQSGQFVVNVMVSCNSGLGQTHCSSVLIPKTMTCDTVQDSIPTIVNQCLSGCDSVAFLVSRPNTALNKTFKYQLFADANLIDTGRFTLTNASTNMFNLKKKRDGRTYRLEIRNPVTNQLLAARSAESTPTVTTPSVSTGFVNQFSQGIKQPNIAENCTANRGAFDPNDKAATPTGIGTRRFIEQGNTIDYLVQFQNTGTDTAFKVVVRDTLAAQFDWATFKLNGQSHTATWQLNPQGILVVTFNNINLVDSFTNERGSHGFFKYSIKLKDSIVTNTIVTNKAAIYFDFNAPIITNLTTHTIGKEGLKNCLAKPAVMVNYTGCPSKNIVFNAISTSVGANPTFSWFRNAETTPLSTTARLTLANASNGTKIYCKLNASDDICTETPVVTSDTIVLNCIGVPTNELSFIQAFDVFPNPNKGVFTVKLNVGKPMKMQLSVLNYLGQTLKSETIDGDNYVKTFDFSAMPKGIYVIKLTVDGQNVVKKVSVQ